MLIKDLYVTGQFWNRGACEHVGQITDKNDGKTKQKVERILGDPSLSKALQSMCKPIKTDERFKDLLKELARREQERDH